MVEVEPGLLELRPPAVDAQRVCESSAEEVLEDLVYVEDKRRPNCCRPCARDRSVHRSGETPYRGRGGPANRVGELEACLGDWCFL